MARSQVVGNVGMYFAAYRLSQMGWNVMPTSRNARGIDLLAYDTTGGRYLGIQVKALSKRKPVPLGISGDNFMGDWWIIVTKIATDKPECFIMKPDEVSRLRYPLVSEFFDPRGEVGYFAVHTFVFIHLSSRSEHSVVALISYRRCIQLSVIVVWAPGEA